MKNEESSCVLYMGTFPPRECGIATFTKDLTTAIDKKFSPLIKSKILAMNNGITSMYNYLKDVVFQIDDTDINEYINIAKEINEIDKIKLVNIQHEFGIFGGEYGSYLIAFLEIINKPVVITFHSVLPNPNKKLKNVVQSLAEKSLCLIVMTEIAVEILRNDYGIKTDIEVIPHGIPNIPFNSSAQEKTKMGYGGNTILLSFGMMNPDKGYEYAIDALPEVIKKFPNVLYFIVGQTHPLVRKKEGEKYRNFLEKKVKMLGFQKNVKFYNKYLKLNEIIRYLQMSDIYICSNMNPDQMVSGTLAYAMGCGRAVISTPFLHAKEIVNPERGLLGEFGNPESFANAIIKILSDQSLKESMEKNAYSFTRYMTWHNVALPYMNVFKKYIQLSERHEMAFPKVKLTHLMKLTDNFGIIQFAKHSKPDRYSGYALDDNARAMIVSCMYYNLFRDESKLKLISTYLNFIKYVQQADGRLFNFVGYDRKINLNRWTDDAHGRALWALGYLIYSQKIPLGLKREAEVIFEKAIKVVEKIKFPRAIAFTIIGLYFYNKKKKSGGVKIRKLADYLVILYNKHSSEKWNWFENRLTYSNSKLSEALFYSYKITKKEKYLKIAKAALDFLIGITFENGVFAPVGQNGWYIRGSRKTHFDQQPVDTASMVQTLIIAYDITKEERYLECANTAFHWFLGKNFPNQMIYDEITGGCHDGLGKSSINLNQGAESTVCYLMARLSLLKQNEYKTFR